MTSGDLYLVPQDRWAEYKYFNEDPGLERRNTVKEHPKASKKQRKDRSVTTTSKTAADDRSQSMENSTEK